MRIERKELVFKMQYKPLHEEARPGRKASRAERMGGQTEEAGRLGSRWSAGGRRDEERSEPAQPRKNGCQGRTGGQGKCGLQDWCHPWGVGEPSESHPPCLF